LPRGCLQAPRGARLPSLLRVRRDSAPVHRLFAPTRGVHVAPSPDSAADDIVQRRHCSAADGKSQNGERERIQMVKYSDGRQHVNNVPSGLRNLVKEQLETAPKSSQPHR
jgi:hypothetical protein